MKQLYKFLRTGLKSQHGDFQWKLGQWEKIHWPLDICRMGFHGSERAINALSYVPGEILALTEVRGHVEKYSDKQAWSEMRIIKAFHWTKSDSVALAVFAAETALNVFEKQYPNDDRPRKAIEEANKYLENQSAATDAAAYAANAAAYAAANAAAYAAGAAARAAAYAARAAADAAAYAAADAAAYAARAAADAAYAARADARASADAAADAALGKIEYWIQQRIATLEPWSK